MVAPCRAHRMAGGVCGGRDSNNSLLDVKGGVNNVRVPVYVVVEYVHALSMV